MSKYLENHNEYMHLAIEQAKKGIGRVSPNPLVGCVIVKNGRIIGEGYHEKFGDSHAEVNALNNCIESPIDSNLYVNLEPCSIYAKTPPCTKAIIENSISEVFIGSLDVNPLVNGSGVEELEKAGIRVHTNILSQKCNELNKYFFNWIKTKRPYVIAKVAQTKDGYMGYESDKSLWITGNESKENVHKLRSEVDAIMVGKNTALIDNPKLTVRKVSGVNPKRIIVDTNRSLPLNLNIFMDKESPTYVLCSNKRFSDNKTSYCNYFAIEEHQYGLNPHSILDKLGQENISSVLIEGGSKLLSSFYNNNLIDEIHLYTSEKVVCDANLINPIKISDDWQIVDSIEFSTDQLVIAKKKDLCLQEL